ncbi:MAG TPA: SDR family oxidoreductase [Steroidobacteraceae bacterium]|nr:SDR family oxidoreductase [Steroidobacteraceae bacterium]
MKAHSQHRPPSRSLALLLLTVALLVAATIAAAFTREAEIEAARANTGLRPVVLVAGASGQTGRLIARRARAEGYAVRATSRDVERASRSVPGDFDWVQLDVRDRSAAREAARNTEFVVCAVGAQVWDGPEGPQYVDYRGVVNLIDAAVAARVKHFVLISSASAGSHRDQSKQARLGHILLWKTKAEDHLKASGLAYTIVGPAGLRNDAGGAKGLRALRREDYRPTYVTRDDVARVAIDALRNPAARNKSFALVNDEAATPEAWRRELEAMRRDAPAGPATQVSSAAGDDRPVAAGRSRFVPPAPARERVMIEEERSAGEKPRVGWTPPAPQLMPARTTAQ